MTTDVGAAQVAWFVLAVVAPAVIQAAAHTVLALADRRTGTDERGRLIALVGARNPSRALATAVRA